MQTFKIKNNVEVSDNGKDNFKELGGKLNAYLADIDRQAQERFERLIEDMKQVQEQNS